MKRTVIAITLFCLVCFVFTGCQVYLNGEARTAVTNSTIDAVEAARRANADPNTAPWLKSYTVENAKQWREFMRSAKRDTAWGAEYDQILEPVDKATDNK